MADQFRFDYLGYAGADHVHTPNLDRLASEGMVFTHCCTNSPTCSPARIGLATGMHPYRLGALDNHAFLPKRVPTYYQRLRDRGYRVGCVGKLDLAKPDPYNGRYGDRPATYSWGFTHPEECEGKMHAGRCNPPKGPYSHWLKAQGLLDTFSNDYEKRVRAGQTGAAAWDSPLPAEAFEDAYIGRRAAEWLDGVPTDFPWHYFVSFVGPHNPFDAPTAYADRYRNASMPTPIHDSLEGKPKTAEQRAEQHQDGPDDVLRAQRQYCAAITLIDDAVGKMLTTLERRGMRDNTIIVFTSDHGELLFDHGLYTKFFFYESALRIPLLITGPGIEPGSTDALVELIDLNPTLCDLAGIGPEPDIDAHSLAPILHRQTDAVHTEIISTLNNGQCLRNHEYKFIHNHGDIPELYDLRKDPNELNNIAPENPELVATFSKTIIHRLLEGEGLR